jgi:NAD(P)H-dependent FMN reductase
MLTRQQILASEDDMLDIAVILGSTRPGCNGAAVATWVHKLAAQRADANFDLLDLREFHLPLLDEYVPPSLGQYSQEHTKAWARTIERYDGFVFVTPEYNHSTSAALKNAIDFVYAEWNNKAAGFVSYGLQGGLRAVEHLRQVMTELQVADVQAQVALFIHSDFENYTQFAPAAHQERILEQMLDQVVAWSSAMQGLRRDALAA